MKLNNMLNDYSNFKNILQNPDKGITPSALFSAEYKRIRDLEAQMSTRHQILFPKIQDRIGLILLNDRIYQRLEKRLHRANQSGDEDLIWLTETKLDLRRQEVIDKLLEQYGYIPANHHRLRQTMGNLMAERVNRLYPIMPQVLKELSKRYRPLRRDLIGCHTVRAQQQLNELLDQFRQGKLTATLLIRNHIKNQEQTNRETLYKIARACMNQFYSNQPVTHLKNKDSRQLMAEILATILGHKRLQTCPEMPVPSEADVILSARQSMPLLERAFPEILANSLAFLKYRTIGKPVRFLSEVDFRYRLGDLFKDGGFFDYGCGRLYYRETLPLSQQNDYAYATGADVLGLGFESFFRNPEKLIRTDEVYFNFIFGNLSGDLDRLTDRILTPSDRTRERDLKDL